MNYLTATEKDSLRKINHSTSHTICSMCEELEGNGKIEKLSQKTGYELKWAPKFNFLFALARKIIEVGMTNVSWEDVAKPFVNERWTVKQLIDSINNA